MNCDVKKIIPALIFAALLVAVASRAAIVVSNLVNYATINNATNTTPAVSLGTVSLPQTTFAIQNGGLTQTNALAVDFYLGFGTNTNNMTFVFTYQPSITNAQIDSTTAAQFPQQFQTIYVLAVIRTTNSVNVGVQSIQQH